MKMSTKGRYGLRLMVALAARHGSGPVRVDAISREQHISANYIHVLMGVLKAAGLVRSIRGANGGYEIAWDPDAITAFDVVTALEGETIPTECIAEPGSCPRAGECPTRDVWCQVAAAVNTVLKGMTMKDLVERQQGLGDALNYSI